MAENDKKKSNRHADAASVIGEELADVLEDKSQEIVGRSAEGIDPMAVVLKDKHAFPPKNGAGKEEDEAPATGTAEEKSAEKEVQRTFDGAITLNAAESYLVREKPDAVLMDSWGVLGGVLTNIAGEEKGPEILAQLVAFQDRLDVKALEGLKTLADFNKEANMPEIEEPQAEAVEAEAVAEAEADTAEETGETPEGEIPEAEEAHPLDEALLAVKVAYDEAKATPVDDQARLQMIQPSVNKLAEELIARSSGKPVEEASAESSATLEAISQMSSVVASLAADVAALKNGNEVAPVVPAEAPVRRAATPADLVAPVAPVIKQNVPSPENVDRFHMPEKIGGAEETPNLRKMIRRSVGARE